MIKLWIALFLFSFATYANSAGSAGSATTATSASHALYANQAGTATSATTATSASFATFANTAGTATSATTAATASYYAGSVTSASFASTASYVSGEAVTTSGQLQFTNILGEVYGSVASPVTGNLTISATSTKRVGAVAIVFHTGSSEPSVTGGTIAKKTGDYSTTALNVITFTNVDGTNYLQYIVGAPVTTVTSASYAVTASFATTASFASSASLATLSFNSNSASGSIGFWQGSQAEYNTISGSASNSIIYFIV